MNTDTSWYEKLDKVHQYPAKFPLELASKYILEYSKPEDIVFDPFVGSGTTLLSASINDRYSYGIDINPIAVLLSKFKITYYSENALVNLDRFLSKLKCTDTFSYHGDLYDYKGIDHWFTSDVIKSLSCIKNEIETTFEENTPEEIFSKVVFSSIVNLVSNQESDTRYAAVEKDGLTAEYVLTCYCKKFTQIKKIIENITRSEEISSHSNAYLYNSKNSTDIIGNSKVNLIVTSPPYPNTYDYYLYHKHRMMWLGYDFKDSKGSEIGSRNEFSSHKQPSSNFTDDLKTILCECDKTMVHDAHAVIIIGDGIIRGELYDSLEHTLDICEEIGWKLEESSFVNLDQTSKSFNKGFRTKGKKEHTIIFRKS